MTTSLTPFPTFTIWVHGTPTEFTSRFRTLADAYKALEASGLRSQFARDLMAKARARKLSSSQVAWLHKLASDLRTPEAVESYPRTAQLLWNAAQAGKAFPRLKLTTKPLSGMAPVAYELKLRVSGEIVILKSGTYAGRLDAEARAFLASRFEAEVRALLATIEADPAKYAHQHGVATGRCLFCGRGLSTKESRSVGYGPDCAEKVGLPWGEVDPQLDAEGKQETL